MNTDGLPTTPEERGVWLHTIASHVDDLAQEGQLSAAIELIERVLPFARSWGMSQDTSAELRTEVMYFFINAGIAAKCNNKLVAAFTYYDDGLTLARSWNLSQGTPNELRTAVMECFLNAALTGRYNDKLEAAIDYCDKGLTLARSWDFSQNTSTELRTVVMLCFEAAGAIARKSDDMYAAFAYYNEGLTLACSWDFSQDASAELRTVVMSLLEDVVMSVGIIGNWNAAYRAWLPRQALLTTYGGEDTSSTLFANIAITLLSDSQCHTATALSYWLHDWNLLGFDPDQHPEHRSRLIELIGALLIINIRERGIGAYMQRIQRIESTLAAAWHIRRKILAHCKRRLLPKHPHPLDKEELLRQALSTIRGWRPILFSSTMRRLKQTLNTPPPIPKKKDVDDVQKGLTTWFAQGICDTHKWGISLLPVDRSVLALWLLCYPLTHRPDPAQNSFLDLLLSSHDWLSTLQIQIISLFHTQGIPSLYVPSLRTTDNGEAMMSPELNVALNALRGGDRLPGEAWLKKAWKSISTTPLFSARKGDTHPTQWDTLSRLAYALETGDNFDWQAALDSTSIVAPDTYRLSALLALVLDDVPTLVAHAAQQQLRRRSTGWDQDKHLIGEMLAHYPERYFSDKWGEKYHALLSAEITERFKEGQPAPKVLWDLLEKSRIALNGLRQQGEVPLLNDAEFQGFVRAVADEVGQSHDPALPPLDRALCLWLEAMNRQGIAIHAPRPEDCQTLLHGDEALAQTFFDAHSGKLHTLWLELDGEVRWLNFPPETAKSNWEPLLDLWSAFLAESSKKIPNEAVIHAAWKAMRAANSPMAAMVATLRAKAEKAQVKRIIWLPEAMLAQFPIEAAFDFRQPNLPPSDLPPYHLDPGFIERAASLTSWIANRRAEKEIAAPVRVIYHDNLEKSATAPWEANAVAGESPERAPEASSSLSMIDGLVALGNETRSHFVMHGHYEPLRPTRSYLQLNDTTKIPAWAIGLTDVPPGTCITLAACQSMLTGRAADTLMGPVGFAPLLVAHGADTVIGSIWNSNQIASWVFYKKLYELIRNASGGSCDWPKLVSEAQKHVREIKGDALAEELGVTKESHHSQSIKGPVVQYSKFKKTSENPSENPFENPYYWAQFVVLGHHKATTS